MESEFYSSLNSTETKEIEESKETERIEESKETERIIIQSDNSDIKWELFLNINEQLLGICDFTQKLLLTVSYQELVLNILKYKPELILNQNILRCLLITSLPHNRITVFELIKLVAKFPEIYTKLFSLKNFWRELYSKRISSPDFEKRNKELSDFEINTDIIYKLCMEYEYNILCMSPLYGNFEGDKISGTNISILAGQMIANDPSYVPTYTLKNREINCNKYVGKILIDDDIKRLCISNYAIFTLNNEDSVIEYFLNSNYERNYAKLDISNEEKIRLNMTPKHLSERILFSDVKEMININNLYDLIAPNITKRIPNNLIVVLTYNGELFFHSMIDNISYTLKFDTDYMQTKFGFGKVINIQTCDVYVKEKVFIIVETEDHSLFIMNVQFLFRHIMDYYISQIKECIVKQLCEIHFTENVVLKDEKLNSMGINLTVSMDQNKSHKVTQIIPENYFFFSYNDQYLDHCYKPFQRVTSPKEFFHERGMSFEQKIRSISPRVFTLFSIYSGNNIIFYHDNEKENGSMYMVFIKQEMNINETFNYIKDEINLSEFVPFFSSRIIQQMDIYKRKDNLKFSNNGMYSKICLQIKSDDKYYLLELLPEQHTRAVYLRPITKEQIIEHIKISKLIELKFLSEGESEVKDVILEGYSRGKYIIDSKKRLLSNHKDVGKNKLDEIEKNVVQLINYGSLQYKDKELVVKINRTNYIYVPYSEYLLYENSNCIVEKLILDNGDVLFRRQNCVYNFKAIK